MDLGLNGKKISVNTENYQTNKEGIFAVGDINDYPGKLDLILSGFHETTLAVRKLIKEFILVNACHLGIQPQTLNYKKSLVLKNRFRKYLPVVVDLETGGFDPEINAILEIAITLIEEENNKLVVGDTYGIILSLLKDLL